MEKRKEINNNILFSSLLMFIPTIIGLLLWKRLPEQIPTHFDINNQIDGYSSKSFVVFVLPLILFVLQLFALFITKKKKKKKNISKESFNTVVWIIPGLSIILINILYLVSLDYKLDVARIVMIFVSVLFIIIGNYLPKTKQNYSLGVRNRWTLEDENNWNITHRYAGYTYVLAGVLLLFVNMFYFNPILIFAIMLVMGIVPLCISYYIYRKNI